MRKNDILPLLYHLAAPLIMIGLGLVLTLSPDSASVLIVRIIAWGFSLTGLGFLLAAIFTRRNVVKKAVIFLICDGIGGFLMVQPLVLAAFAGRLLGVLVALRGLRDFFLSRKFGHGQILAGIVTIVGITLAALPMTTSRLVFRLCGGVMILVGIFMLMDKWKTRRLDRGDDNIIDAL